MLTLQFTNKYNYYIHIYITQTNDESGTQYTYTYMTQGKKVTPPTPPLREGRINK